MSSQLPTVKPFSLVGSAFWAGAILLILHLVGLVGLHLPQTKPIFLLLVPLNLLVTTFTLLLYGPLRNMWFWVFVVAIVLSGILVEIQGIASGQIFGVYTYGPVLGPKLMGVPLLIGLNWLLLVYATGSLVSRLPVPDVLKCIIAAFLMTLLDYFIEPVAQYFNFWSWESAQVPLQNYGAWFVISGIMQAFFFSLPFEKYNPLAFWICSIQFFFFAGNLLLKYLLPWFV